MSEPEKKGRRSPAKGSAKKGEHAKRTTEKSGGKDAVSRKSGPVEELARLSEQLSSEEVQFLIRQATTMLYNRKVDELNEAADRLNRSRRMSLHPPTAGRSEPRAGDRELVDIERGAFGSSYIIVVKNQRKTMAEYEMAKLTHIAHTAETPADGIAQLYRWLQRNRDDVILDAGLSPRDLAMRELYERLKAEPHPGGRRG